MQRLPGQPRLKEQILLVLHRLPGSPACMVADRLGINRGSCHSAIKKLVRAKIVESRLVTDPEHPNVGHQGYYEVEGA